MRVFRNQPETQRISISYRLKMAHNENKVQATTHKLFLKLHYTNIHCMTPTGSLKEQNDKMSYKNLKGIV
jgi:hypothetical protein